ncbi:MAG: aspartate kinase [Acidimicrobiia bacterium]|nr:aspartate kinase [Acidimicrobiia bacterium]
MALIVQKFGGTSVADADRIREVADQVARNVRHGNQVILVISAMGKETDELLRLAGDVARLRPGREMDMLITAGERKAIALVAMALADKGLDAVSFTGSQIGFITDTNHMNAKILEVRPERLREALERGQVPVVAGAQGVSTDRDVTFLGRGGSDTTAVAIAHVMAADVCELYTDVSGVYSADPRLVPGARRMAEVTFDELLEMTATGCPKPAMRSVEFARSYGVTLHVRSAFTWEPGTWVREETRESAVEEASVIAVTHDTSDAKVTVERVADHPGVAASLFRRLAERGVNVDMIVQNVSLSGHTDISFTVPQDSFAESLATCRSMLGDLGAKDVTGDEAVGKVSIVGSGMKSDPGVAARMFEALGAAGVNIEMISTSPIRTSCVVRRDQVETAVQVLHQAFDLDA